MSGAPARRIAITGALGHIGSRLIQTLPAAFPGVELVLIDNLSSERYCSVFNLARPCRFLELDVLDGALEHAFAGCDAVIHLAAITNAAGSFDIREKVEHENYRGTERVAEACLAAGVPLISLSSTSVYGQQDATVDEDCAIDALRPQSPYAETKLREERLLARLGGDRGLRFVICRFGTIFGISPGMRFHTAVNKFCWQASCGQPLTVWRTALHQVRPYLDIEDAVSALAFLIARRCFDGRIYNVLTLNATVEQIVGEIRRHAPSLRVELVDARIMNQLSYEVSDGRFRSTGFRVRGNLARGIADTMDLLKGIRG